MLFSSARGGVTAPDHGCAHPGLTRLVRGDDFPCKSGATEFTHPTGWSRLGRGYVQPTPGRPNRHPLAAAPSFTRAREYHNSATAGVSRNRVKLDWTAVDDALATYFRAWNEQDPEQRRRLLERSVTDDAVLVDPTGRWEGVPGLAERIGRYQSAAPDTEVVTASGVDAHNDLVRYAWKIVDRQGHESWRGSTLPSASMTGVSGAS